MIFVDIGMYILSRLKTSNVRLTKYEKDCNYL
jgi:hypothetical protein